MQLSIRKPGNCEDNRTWRSRKDNGSTDRAAGFSIMQDIHSRISIHVIPVIPMSMRTDLYTIWHQRIWDETLQIPNHCVILADTPPYKWNGKNQTVYKQDGMRFSTVLTRTEQFTYKDLDAISSYIMTGITVPSQSSV